MKSFLWFMVFIAVLVYGSSKILSLNWPGNNANARWSYKGNVAKASVMPASVSAFAGASGVSNNPLGIKFSGNIAEMNPDMVVENSGYYASDGGSFARFPSYQHGMTAGKRLLMSSGYRNLTIDAAMRRWSNKGYGAEITSLSSYQTVGSLTDSQLDELLAAMARREGTTKVF